MRFGSTRKSRARCQKLSSTSSISAPAVFRTSPFGTVFVPSISLSSAGSDGSDHLDEPDPLRLAGTVVRRLGDHLARRHDVAVVLARELADVRGSVVDDLPAQILRDVRTVERDRRRRADVGLGSHGRQVRRHRDDGSRGVGGRARRGDVDDDRDLGGEEALHDASHRRAEAAGRVEDEHVGGIPAVLGAVHRVLDELLRDGVDVVVEVRGENARRVSGRRIVPSENTRHRHERRYSEREGKKSPQNGAWHRCKDSISGGSPLLPANGSRATLDFRAPTSRHPPRPACRPAGRSECVRLEFGACDDGRPADWRTACGDDGCSAAVHACRGLVAWQRPSGVADTLDRRPLERLATCGA